MYDPRFLPRRGLAALLHGLDARLQLALVSVLLLALSVTACDLTTDPEEMDGGGVGLKQSSFPVGDPGCSQTTSVRSGAAGLTLDEFGRLLRDGGIDYVEGRGLDWALSLISGKSGTDKSLDEIKKSVSVTGERVSQIQHMLCEIDQQMQQDYVDLKETSLKTAYQASLQSLNAPLAAIYTVRDDFHTWTTPTPTYDPYTQLSRYTQQIAEGRTSIKSAITQLGNGVAPVSPGSGPIYSYDKLLQFLVSQDPPDGAPPIVQPDVSKLVTNSYGDPMGTLVDYYTGAMLTAIDLANELYRVDARTTSDQADSSGPLTGTAEQLTARGLSYVDLFQKRANSVGQMPANTVVDFSSQTESTPAQMWTQFPVNLDERPGTPSYCRQPDGYCLEAILGDNGEVLNSSLASGPADLTAAITTHGPGSLTDWRVPTADELTDLTKGAQTTSANASTPGVAASAASRGLEAFKPASVNARVGGPTKKVDFIGPFLVTTKASGDGVLSSSDPTKTTLTLHTPRRVGADREQLAGKLLLVRDATPHVFCDSGCHAILPGSDRLAKEAPKPRPHPSRQPIVEPRRKGAPKTLKAAALNDPVTFTQPTTCSAGPTFTVPSGANAIKVVVNGGAGGAGKLENHTNAAGGRGGQVTTILPATPGSTLHIQVGSNGGDTTAGIGGGGSGGATVEATWPDGKKNNHAGGGGGASGIAADAACTLWLAVAGGGGGGGSGFSQGGTSSGQWLGGAGGDACPEPVPATGCVAAGSGSDHYPAGKLGTAGGHSPTNFGGHSRDQTKNAYTEVGGNGTTLSGGRGSDGDRSNSGGAGGGGGGGYFGGGGGGGGGYRAGGGGGGGGGTFVANGATSSTAGTTTDAPSVTITPVRN